MTDLARTDDDVIDVEVVLDAQQARALTDRIRKTLTVAHELIIEAFQGRAWTALGYDSWDAYCAGEFGDARMVRLDREQRREIVAEMRQAGMSTPAIGSSIGVSHVTVQRDLATCTDVQVGQITSVNGKQHAPQRQGLNTPSVAEIRESEAPREEAARQAQPRQRPLPDQFFDAAYELTKAVERIQRLAADDRFPRNAEQVAAKHRGDLTRAADVLADVMQRLP